MPDILVVGAGPVGLTMAAELVRHGVRCRIVDRNAAPSPFCRAIGVTPRTLEVWDDMGIVRQMIDAGLWIEGLRSVIDGHPPHDIQAAFPDLPYGMLALPQYETERLLSRHLEGFGIKVERGVTLTALAETGNAIGVTLDHDDGTHKEAAFSYVIGCDGAHSAVRRLTGIAFEGDAFPMMFMLGDVHIDWELARGWSLRALRLVEDSAPDMFIAIPLPEQGRYRVSTLAPATMNSTGGTGHGIQSEMKGPELAALQAIANDLLHGKPRLSDLRWSSLFRISMRLADHYRQGRVFIAGDAAHIHPPTGGQGMNTGIQDAYNLAWKLALVSKGTANAALLDSYESERRPVGIDVVARTRKASEQYGRERGGQSDRLADTQVLISYRGGDWVRDDRAGIADPAPAPGDRAPDATGLRRRNIGSARRLFDVLRGTEHLLIAYLPNGDPEAIADLAAFAATQSLCRNGAMRVAAVLSQPSETAEPAGVALYHDQEGEFAAAYGTGPAAFLIRPDGHVGWPGRSWRDLGLPEYLARVFTAQAVNA
jgi:2-polyprenyl-6-methoxyphenol hydroxylase-like FAD-dependent oxidoreductase